MVRVWSLSYRRPCRQDTKSERLTWISPFLYLIRQREMRPSAETQRVALFRRDRALLLQSGGG